MADCIYEEKENKNKNFITNHKHEGFKTRDKTITGINFQYMY